LFVFLFFNVSLKQLSDVASIQAAFLFVPVGTIFAWRVVVNRRDFLPVVRAVQQFCSYLAYSAWWCCRPTREFHRRHVQQPDEGYSSSSNDIRNTNKGEGGSFSSDASADLSAPLLDSNGAISLKPTTALPRN
jgi:hypothetical protein